MVGVVFLSVLYVGIGPYFPTHKILDSDPSSEDSIFHRVFSLYVVGIIIRSKFYTAWLLSDAVYNANGMGFNGYDAETGEPKWDLHKNVEIINLELSMNIKSVFNNWNMQTQLWLRRIVYER